MIFRVFVLVLALAGCGPSVPQHTDERLPPLYDALAAAPSAEAALILEEQIATIWADHESPTVEILIERAQSAFLSSQPQRARLLLDEAVALAPEDAELRRRRAVVAAEEGAYAEALVDLEAALERDPRHFGAMLALGALYERTGQAQAALEAYRQALAVYPHLEEAKQAVARLGPEVVGEDI